LPKGGTEDYPFLLAVAEILAIGQEMFGQLALSAKSFNYFRTHFFEEATGS
jgi:hypothetical protein